jgi:hypothetical protein
MAGGAVFKLGSFGNFAFLWVAINQRDQRDQRDAGPKWGNEEAQIPPFANPPSPRLRRTGASEKPQVPKLQPSQTTIYIYSSPATITGAEEKKTGPSRFNEDF